MGPRRSWDRLGSVLQPSVPSRNWNRTLQHRFKLCSLFWRVSSHFSTARTVSGGHFRVSKMDPRRSWDRLGSVLFPSCGLASIWGRFWVPLGAVWGCSWCRFGPFREDSWGVFIIVLSSLPRVYLFVVFVVASSSFSSFRRRFVIVSSS